MKKVNTIILMILSFIFMLNADAITSNSKITDIYTSWRGLHKWHKASDFTILESDSVYSIEYGKVYEVIHKEYDSYIIIGNYENNAYCYGHVVTDLKKGNYVNQNEFIGFAFNTTYKHVHLEMTDYFKDTLNINNWIGSDNYRLDPIKALNYSYPMNLQKPEFFRNETPDWWDTLKMLSFEEVDNCMSGLIDQKNEIKQVYGAIKASLTTGCFSGIINSINDSVNYYEPENNFNREGIIAGYNVIENISPKFSTIYNLGFNISGYPDIFWQINSELWSYETINSIDLDCVNGLFKYPQNGISPHSYYIFTNIDPRGDLHPDSLNVNYHWSTNMKQSLPGFYADPSNSDNFAQTNGEAKYQDGVHWVKVYATNYPTTDINDTAHVSMDSVPVLIDNFAPAYSSNYSLFNTFIFDTTTNQEYLLGSYNISQYDEFRVYDNMKLNLVLGPTESINENIVSGAFYDTNGNINNRNFVFLGYEFTDSRVEVLFNKQS